MFATEITYAPARLLPNNLWTPWTVFSLTCESLKFPKTQKVLLFTWNYAAAWTRQEACRVSLVMCRHQAAHQGLAPRVCSASCWEIKLEGQLVGLNVNEKSKTSFTLTVFQLCYSPLVNLEKMNVDGQNALINGI